MFVGLLYDIYLKDGPNQVNNFNYPYATSANIQEIRKTQKVQEEIAKRKWSINELTEEEIIIAYNKLNNKEEKYDIEKLDSPEEFSSKAENEKLEKYEMFLKWMEQKKAPAEILKNKIDDVKIDSNKEEELEVTLPCPKYFKKTEENLKKVELFQKDLYTITPSREEVRFEDFKDTVSISSDEEFLELEDNEELPQITLKLEDKPVIKIPLEETINKLDEVMKENIIQEVEKIDTMEKVFEDKKLPEVKAIKLEESKPVEKILSNPILDLFTRPVDPIVTQKPPIGKKLEDPVKGIEQEKAIITSIKSSLENIEKIMIEAKFTLTDSPLEIKSSVTNLCSSNSSLSSSSDTSSASAESVIRVKPSHSKGRAPPPPVLSILSKPSDQTTSEQSAGQYFDQSTKKFFKETEL